MLKNSLARPIAIGASPARKRVSRPLSIGTTCCAFVFASCVLQADTFRLVDDSKVSGNIRSLESNTLLVVDSSDNTIKIPMRDISEWSIGRAEKTKGVSVDAPWTVRLSNDGIIRGAIDSIDNSRLVIRTHDRLLPKFEIPLEHILSCVRRATNTEPKDNPSKQDVVLTQVSATRSIEVSGRIIRKENDRLIFEFKGKQRSIRWAKIDAFFPARNVVPFSELFFLGRFSDSITVPFLIDELQNDLLILKTLWGEIVRVPSDGHVVLSARNGKLKFVSDLTPIIVKQVPFFDRIPRWQKDRALDGGRLVLGNIVYAKGLAMHSHCELVYALENEFARLMVTLGIDDRKQELGNVDVAIYADEKEIFRNRRVDGTIPPITLDLPLFDVNRLKLVARYGEGQDAGDELIWANARLLRK